jgi:hypothetical protein
MSSWVSQLLYRLLQWPGLDVKTDDPEWPDAVTLDALKKVVKDRLKFQESLYGRSSDLPVYVERICPDLKGRQHLQVVMVQSLLPKMDDFVRVGPKLDEPDYRLRHRGHVATMARLAYDKLVAVRQAAGEALIKPLADLIIFPELSVHRNDIRLLKQLADKTGAMIFTGLVFQEREGDLINTALWLIPFRNGYGRQWITRFQGKQHMTIAENGLGIKPWRPYQLIIELVNTPVVHQSGFRLSGSICYDATDISLAADLKDISDALIVPAMNRDIDTFDSMVGALHYHMFQYVVLDNTGEFGGTAAMAPYKEKYHRQIAHVHGNNQIAISMFDMNMHDFSSRSLAPGSGKEIKTRPAGLSR